MLRPAPLLAAAVLTAAALLTVAQTAPALATPALATPALAAPSLATPAPATAAPARTADDPAPTPTAPLPGDPARNVLLGVVGGQAPVKTTARLTAFQTAAQRTVATVRVYALWDTAWPDPLSLAARSAGQQVVLSVKSKTRAGLPVSYASVAAAQPGDPVYQQVLTWAAQVSAYGGPVFFTYNHEPEVYKSDTFGTAAQYVQAWQRIVTIFREHGVTNAEYVFIGTALGYTRTGARAAAAYYPGDDWVDDVAADGYNWSTCRPQAPIAWNTPQAQFESLRLFGLQHPLKGLMIGEFGSVEDPAVPGRKAAWFDALRTMLEQPGHGQFRGVAEWYSAAAPGACNWQIDTSATALDAFRSWGADPVYAATAVQPSTPRQVTAVAGTDLGTALLTWAPAGTGGSPVTAYTVRIAETGEAITVPGTATSLAYVAPVGLPVTGPSTYTVTVTATNALGTSQPSPPRAVVLSAR